jgi:hypothetical protein
LWTPTMWGAKAHPPRGRGHGDDPSGRRPTSRTFASDPGASAKEGGVAMAKAKAKPAKKPTKTASKGKK